MEKVFGVLTAKSGILILLGPCYFGCQGVKEGIRILVRVAHLCFIKNGMPTILGVYYLCFHRAREKIGIIRGVVYLGLLGL